MTRRITWDASKARSNLVKHGVSFGEAEEVFDDVLSITVIDPSQPAEEERFITVGVSKRGRLLTIGHADTEFELRIITAREATKKERRNYEG